MAEIFVESWAPEYGTPLLPDDDLADPQVDESVEVSGDWEPIAGVDDGIERVAFVDGVRRVDARLTLIGDEGPVPGLCGTHAVGAVTWDRTSHVSEVSVVRLERLALFSAGAAAPMPTTSGTAVSGRLDYRTESVAENDPGALIQRFHGSMRKAEAVVSEELAQAGSFVIADGPINDLSATEKVGYIKSHRVFYLSPARAGIIGLLTPGSRTPLFLIGAGGAYPRYSWYVKLAEVPGGHDWSGVARAELSSHLDARTARTVADRTTALLPFVASPLHVDPRAPQNLVPIAALERELRRHMGDPAFVYRALREAAMRQSAGVAQ